MKKRNLLSLGVIFLSACSQLNKESTLADAFRGFNFFSKSDKIEVVEKTKYINENEPTINYIGLNQNPQEVISEDEEIVAGYNLAKRGERYDAAEYNIDPQVYGIVAARAVNKMLAEAPALFAENKDASLYIENTTIVDRYMPTIPEAAESAAKEVIVGSQMFNITENKDDAKYILKSYFNNSNTPELPVFVYDLKLYDAAGKLLGAWSDNIRQVQNDDGSWW